VSPNKRRPHKEAGDHVRERDVGTIEAIGYAIHLSVSGLQQLLRKRK